MLKFENVCKAFGEKEVLKHLNLSVNEGSIFGLVGMNGAGKSTLLRLIAGVYQCDEGRILLNGEDTAVNHAVRRRIAYVADEQFYPLGSTIEGAKLLYSSMYEFDEDRYAKYLEVFELNEKDAVSGLSKGMRRRAALLFALCTKPDLLLLDEAYDGLEPLTRLKFRKILAELVSDENLTVIISGHNLKELEDICDSFGILDEGMIIQSGDLNDNKENINKYQIAFAEDLPADAFHDFDLMHAEKEGRVFRLVIKGNEEEVLDRLESMKPVLLDVLPVSFEELFIYEVEKRGFDYE